MNKIRSSKIAHFIFLLCFLTLPTFSKASELNVSGWIPYWKFEEGIKSAEKNIKKLDQIYPFVFSVKTDGALKSLVDIDTKKIKKFFKLARSNDVEIFPTVMWNSGSETHHILSNESLRENHIESIYEMIKSGKFDGVDIDYESKWAETNQYFSLFLKELKDKIGSKTLVCTIEPRTPPDSLYREIPQKLEYANDYNEIGKICDQVVIMAYDQQRADIKLNSEKMGTPYAPVSDVDWVKKVFEYTMKTIPKEKLVLGIPTYGHEYEVIATPQRLSGYSKLWALNPVYANDTADEYDIKPSRNKAGEMGFSYFPKESKFKILNELSVPKGTLSGDEVSIKALLFAEQTKIPVTFNVVSWSDSEAVNQKIELARKLGIKGVSLFKIDGGEDKKIWSLF